jgi:hypothetical protein
MCRCDPRGHRIARLLGDLELHWPLRLLLHDDCAGGDMAALDDIVYAKRDQIASAQLAINGEIEQCEISVLMIQLQSNPNGPDLLRLQWRLVKGGSCCSGLTGACRPILLKNSFSGATRKIPGP